MDLCSRIEAVVRAAGPSGLHQHQLESFREPMPSLNAAISQLVQQRRVAMRTDENRQITLYMPTEHGGLSEGCALILDEIRKIGGEGIDLPTIMMRTKIIRMEANKAIKILLGKSLIEEARCFTNKAKKVYILSGVQLSHSVTGGVFYTMVTESKTNKTHHIDAQFVDRVREEILNFIRHHKVVSTGQIKQYFDSKSLPKSLNQRDIDIVTQTLFLDGFIERVSPMDADTAASALKTTLPPRLFASAMASGSPDGGPSPSSSGPSSGTPSILNSYGNIFYKVADNINHSILKASSLEQVATVATQVPCMGCPLLGQCSASGLGPVNPTKCTYLTEWLKME